MRFSRHLAGLILSLSMLALPSFAAAQFVSLTEGTPASQDFDGLAASGTSSALPNGWYLKEGGSNANASYAADDGNANAGNTYSYGASGSGERAFGMLRSGNLQPLIGARLRNDSTLTVSEIAIAYTGEQWRLGASGRTDTLVFQYSLDAGSLDDGSASWTQVGELGFSSPVSSGTVGPRDGNAATNRSARAGTIAGLALAPGGGLWVRWTDTDISGAEDGLAIDDVSFTIGGNPPLDLPPSVTATTPPDQAPEVAPGATLALSFSEAVTLTQPWFSLECSLSGSHTGSASGGPQHYSLQPAPAFSSGDDCVWTLFAAAVTDLDGSPDPMLADHVVNFHVVDPALVAPTLVSSQPADGASGVALASDVRLYFSQPVVTDDAFALSCAGSPLGLIETGAGAERTLTPDTLLPAGAHCVFTIFAAAVENTSGVPMAANLTIGFDVASDSVGSYYDAVNASSPEQLRCSLHLLIRGHTAYPYSGAGTNAWTILELAQADPNDPDKILDVYRNRLYRRGSDRAGGGGGGLKYNREHTWPNSLGFPGATGNLGLPNAPYTDTHMLWLSDEQWNADRGNKPYAFCPSGCGERPTEFNGGVGGGSGTYPGNSNWVNGSSFEVWNHRKGDMARAVMYMAIRYEGGVDSASGQNEPDLELTNERALIVPRNDYSQPAYMGILNDLLAWHQADPPDAEERARDEVIFSFQGNRNPFVDHPEWASLALFQSGQPAVCEPGGGDRIFADDFDS